MESDTRGNDREPILMGSDSECMVGLTGEREDRCINTLEESSFPCNESWAYIDEFHILIH